MSGTMTMDVSRHALMRSDWYSLRITQCRYRMPCYAREQVLKNNRINTYRRLGMLIAFENNIINTDQITTAGLSLGALEAPLSDTKLYILFSGGNSLRFEGVEAIRLWEYLSGQSVPVSGLELPAGTISPDRPWLEEQIEELGQHISETGLTA